MVKKLRVRIGPDREHLTIANVNDVFHPVEIDSEQFVGRVLIRVKDFNGITPDGSEPIKHISYFEKRSRKFCLQWEGRFKQEWSADEVWFGTDFDRMVPIPKEPFEIGMRIAKLIDPAMFYNLNSSRPYIQSPIVCGVTTLSAWPCPDAQPRALVGLRHVEHDPDGDDFVPIEELTKDGRRKPKSYWRFIGFKDDHPSVQHTQGVSSSSDTPVAVNSHLHPSRSGSEASTIGSTNYTRLPLKDRFSTLGRANRKSMDVEFLDYPVNSNMGVNGSTIIGIGSMTASSPPKFDFESSENLRDGQYVSREFLRSPSPNSSLTSTMNTGVGPASGLKRMFSKLKIGSSNSENEKVTEQKEDMKQKQPLEQIVADSSVSIYEDARDDLDINPPFEERRSPIDEMGEGRSKPPLVLDTGVVTSPTLSFNIERFEPPPSPSPVLLSPAEPKSSNKRASIFGSYIPKLWSAGSEQDSSPLPSEITTADRFQPSRSPSSSHPPSPNMKPMDENIKGNLSQLDFSNISTNLDAQLGPWRWSPETDPLEDNLFVFGTEVGPQSISKRRKYFLDKENREKFKFDKDVVYCCSFFSPHMDFNTFSLKLGLSINVFPYLHGMPVRYTCRSSLDDSITFFVIEFQLVDVDSDA